MQHLDHTERQIITALIDATLAQDLRVSVYDGEEWTLSRSTDRAAIRAAIGTTDETTIAIWTKHPEDGETLARLGNILLIHGNGEDVISDCTDSATICALCDDATGTNALKITLGTWGHGGQTI